MSPSLILPACRQAAEAGVVSVSHDASSRILLTCEHASPLLPPSVTDFGVSEQDRLRHIGWDIGAAMLTQHLSQTLSLDAYYGAYSRLWVDLNRDPTAPSIVPTVSDHVPVPGNIGLTDAEREERLQHYFWPYHAGIKAWVDARLQQYDTLWIISMHSFTPTLDGQSRPWDVGVLWHQPHALANIFLSSLQATSWQVGDNEPYSGKQRRASFCMHHHARANVQTVALEVRQDHLQTQFATTAETLTDVLRPMVASFA